MSDEPYPPLTHPDIAEQSRGYKDLGAASLYRDSGGPALAQASKALYGALLKQALKLQFYSTPFTKRSANTLLTTMAAIERVELQLERWHHLIYPNQQPQPELPTTKEQ